MDINHSTQNTLKPMSQNGFMSVVIGEKYVQVLKGQGGPEVMDHQNRFYDVF
jgi:hypothetical protein